MDGVKLNTKSDGSSKRWMSGLDSTSLKYGKISQG